MAPYTSVSFMLAGGSMFAQTRFSFGVSVGSNRGYNTYVDPNCAPPVYNSYVAPSYVAPRYDFRCSDNRFSRFDNGWDWDRDRRAFDSRHGHDRDDNRRSFSSGFRNR